MTESVRGVGAPPDRYLEAAEAVTQRLLREHPELVERYGERGRAFGVHDTAYQIDWIVTAVDLGSAARLRRDLFWLRDLLRARNFPIALLRRNFELAIAASVEFGFVTEEQLAAVVRPVLAEMNE